MNSLDVEYIFISLPQILEALPVTLLIAFVSMFVGLVLGFCIALIKIYKVPVLNQIALFYVSFIRGTPILVQLFLAYYGVPWLISLLIAAFSPGSSVDFNRIDPLFFALFAFSINMSAYLSETVRAAIESVDRGQIEAAYSIGLKPWQVMLKIVLPQAAINAIPNLGNSMISLVKDTSIVCMVMVFDVLGMAKILGARSLRYLEVYISVSIIYWVVCIVLELGFRLLERRLSVSRRALAE
jgi:L-cystine transport system permease protein